MIEERRRAARYYPHWEGRQIPQFKKIGILGALGSLAQPFGILFNGLSKSAKSAKFFEQGVLAPLPMGFWRSCQLSNTYQWDRQHRHGNPPHCSNKPPMGFGTLAKTYLLRCPKGKR